MGKVNDFRGSGASELGIAEDEPASELDTGRHGEAWGSLHNGFLSADSHSSSAIPGYSVGSLHDVN